MPWKRTAEQEDTIDDQVRAAKATIAKEEEEFKLKKERHLSRYRPRRVSHADKDAVVPETEADADTGRRGGDAPEPTKKESEPHKAGHHHDPHDESGDVLVEADEDMVIY